MYIFVAIFNSCCFNLLKHKFYNFVISSRTRKTSQTHTELYLLTQSFTFSCSHSQSHTHTYSSVQTSWPTQNLMSFIHAFILCWFAMFCLDFFFCRLVLPSLLFSQNWPLDKLIFFSSRHNYNFEPYWTLNLYMYRLGFSKKFLWSSTWLFVFVFIFLINSDALSSSEHVCNIGVTQRNST